MTVIELRILTVAGLLGVALVALVLAAIATRVIEWAKTARARLDVQAARGDGRSAGTTSPPRNPVVDTPPHALLTRQAMWRLRC